MSFPAETAELAAAVSILVELRANSFPAIGICGRKGPLDPLPARLVEQYQSEREQGYPLRLRTATANNDERDGGVPRGPFRRSRRFLEKSF